MSDFPRMTHYVAAFLRRKWDVCRKWDRLGLLRWVQWYIDHDLALLITDRNRLQCVAFYRCVNKPDDIRSPFANNERGKVGYIEVCASRGKAAMQGAFDVFLRRVAKHATHIAWVRSKYSNRFTIQPLNLATRHLSLAVALHNHG